MFEEQIALGAAWLDEHKPGWERLIDPQMLDMHNTCKCVLGQVFKKEAEQANVVDGFDYDDEGELISEPSGFNWVMKDLDGVDENFDSHVYGFNIMYRPLEHSGNRFMEAWDTLESEWIDLVKSRFDSGQLSDERTQS